MKDENYACGVIINKITVYKQLKFFSIYFYTFLFLIAWLTPPKIQEKILRPWSIQNSHNKFLALQACLVVEISSSSMSFFKITKNAV